MGIWRTVAKRPAEMDCSELYYGGPKYKAGYTPISEDLCYAFLLEENLDRSFVGEGPNGALLKERGQGYGGIWGQVRDSLADDAIVNYQWIEAICVDSPWHRGRSIIIGDAAHACPPLIAQGAAMCAEDAVILAEMLTSGDTVDDVLPAFMERRFPRVKMVLDNSLTLAEWEIHPETAGRRPGPDHGPDPGRPGRAGLMLVLRDDDGLRGGPGRPDLQPAADRPAARGRASRPTTEAEVVAAVRLARERGWQVAVRSGGHSWAQWSVRDDALVIDLGLVCESSRTTRRPGSCRPRRRSRAAPSSAPYLEARGRFFPGGHCPTVGIGGFLLQGGQGWNARGWGWAAEYVEAVDVVTAAGELVRASASENADLYWAARGAGPGFPGVVTRFHLRTLPAARARRADRARLRPRRLRRGDDLAARDPRLGRGHRRDRRADQDRPDHRRRRRCCWSPASRSSTPLTRRPPRWRRSAPHPALDRALLVLDAIPTTLDEQRKRQLEDNPEGHRWAVDNAWLSGPAADVVPAMRRAYTTLPNDKAFTIWFSMAPLRTLPDMAFSLQSEIYLASYVAWEDPADDDRCRSWLEAAMADLEPVTVGQYLGDSDLSRRQLRFMSDDAWARLQHDPRRPRPGRSVRRLPRRPRRRDQPQPLGVTEQSVVEVRGSASDEPRNHVRRGGTQAPPIEPVEMTRRVGSQPALRGSRQARPAVVGSEPSLRWFRGSAVAGLHLNQPDLPITERQRSWRSRNCDSGPGSSAGRSPKSRTTADRPITSCRARCSRPITTPTRPRPNSRKLRGMADGAQERRQRGQRSPRRG